VAVAVVRKVRRLPKDVGARLDVSESGVGREMVSTYERPQLLTVRERASAPRDAPAGLVAGQLVHASVAGPVVTVAAPPVAVTLVREGNEKKLPAQAAGALDAMVTSFVRLTLRLLFAPTVSGEVRVCAVPLVAVATFQVTALGVAAEHPATGEESPESPYPVA
jgi:hypothetical protein